MSRSRKHIVVIGSINMDLVSRTPVLPRPGQTILGSDFTMVPGGKGANQAVAAAKLARDADVHMIGRVGADDLGRRLLDGLREHRVDTRHVRVTRGVASGVAMIIVDRKGENSIVVAPGANAMVTPDDVDAAEGLIRSASAVMMQLEIPLVAVRHAIKMCRRHGVFTILDPAPAPPRMPRDLFQIDLLTPNLGEARSLLTRRDDVKGIARGLIERGARAVAIKLGKRGSFMMTYDGVSRSAPGFKVKAIDTTAAGDAFTAALAVAHVEGKDGAEMLRFANATGAVCCQTFGAQPSLPSRRSVDALLRRS